MDVEWTDVSVYYGSTQVLFDVYGKVSHGELLAVVGPSGAGKSTLLNAITSKLPMKTGRVTVNGQKMTSLLRRQIAYVVQQELFFPNLTLRETLHFSAMMRIPDSMTYAEKMAKMNHIIDELELNQCLDTLVGNAVVRGLSGGQRKRANIACEIVGDPTIIAIDEPTSGLDSAIALKIMKLLKRYTANNNKSVLINIHQPNSQIFEMFDNILLITSGKVGYFGLGKDLLSYLTDIGLHCELHYNPAEYAMECVKVPEKEEKIVAAASAMRSKYLALPSAESEASIATIDSKSDVKKLINGGKLKGKDEIIEVKDGEEDYIILHSWMTGFFTQYQTLMSRHVRQRFRVAYSWFNVINTAVVALFFGLVWFQLEKTDEAIMYKQGLMFLFVIHFGFRTAVAEVIKYHGDRDILNRERSSGMYRVSAYFTAMLTSDTILGFPLPTLAFIIIYWMAGLTADVGLFLAIMGIFVLFIAAGQSINWLIAVSIDNSAIAISVAYTFQTFMACAAGYLIKNETVWLGWTKYASVTYYTFEAMQKVEFLYGTGLLVSPPDNETTTIFDPQTNCTFTTNSSRAINTEEHLTQSEPLWLDVVVLSAAIVLFRILGYMVLRYFKKPHKKN